MNQILNQVYGERIADDVIVFPRMSNPVNNDYLNPVDLIAYLQSQSYHAKKIQ